MADCASCFSAGDIAVSVIVPLVLATIIAAAVVIALWKFRKIVFCPGRKLIKSPEGNGSTGHQGGDHGEAYQNPGFVDDMDTPVDVAVEEGRGGFAEGNDSGKKAQSPKKNGQKGSPKSQQPSLSKFELPAKNLSRMVSTTSLDDTFLNTNPEVVSVCLQSQDFIGLGFNIQGSMRDGIRVSQVHNRGPAIESGKITAGDRIQSVTISFEKMVYEDALTILSYASPYPVKITLQKNGRMVPDRRSASDLHMQLNHPIYRSQSLDALTGIGKDPAFKKKRNFSEMKSDSHRNGHPKIHTVQLSSCAEPEIKQSPDIVKWRDVNLPDFQDGKLSDEAADKMFSEADKLFVDSKKNAEKKEVKLKTDLVEASGGEISFNTTADKTDTSFFDVTSGNVSMLSDTTVPSDTLEDVTVSFNETPEKDKVQQIKSEMGKAALEFDALFSKLETDKKSSEPDSNVDKNPDIALEEDDRDGRTVNLFDVNLEMDEAEARVNKASSDFVDAKKSLETEAEMKIKSYQDKTQEIEESIVPQVQTSRLKSALNSEESVEEDEIVPETRHRPFEIDSQIEFEEVETDTDADVKDKTAGTENLTVDMLQDSMSVEASVTSNVPDDEPVEEESLEAITVRRDSSNDKIYGASLRDSRPLFQDEVVVDDALVADSVTKQFSAPNFSQVTRSKSNSSSGEEEISADEGEYKIQTQGEEEIVVSHDLSTEDLKLFKTQMMADRSYRTEASSGDVVHELRGGNSDDDTEIAGRPITRAISYDVVHGSPDINFPEGRTGSFKGRDKGQSESGYLEWSGKRLVRSGSFSEIPTDGEDRDWTFNNNINDEPSELKKYKNFEDLRGSDSEPEDKPTQVIKTKIHPVTDILNLSGNNSDASSRSSSPVTANGGDNSTHTSRETSHFVSKSYTVTSSSKSDGGNDLEFGRYSFTVRSGSDGEESDSMA